MNTNKWEDAFSDTPKSFKDKVNATLNNLPDKKEKDEMNNVKLYKRGSIKKKIIVALVATMVLGTTVFAAGKISSIFSSSSIIPTYTTLPTAEQVNKDFKFTPKIVEKFDNGYTFEKGTTNNNEGRDESGNSVKKTKSLDFTYTKGKDKLSLTIENDMIGERSKNAKVIDTYSGIELYYNTDAYKFEPADYKLTEQDKQDKLSGKYIFSYGSDKEEITQVQYLDWIQDGIHYSFLAMGSPIEKDEIVKMARQVIATK